MSVESALEHAKKELLKLKLSNTQVDNYKQAASKKIIDQSIMFADRVLKNLIAHTMSRSVDEVFEDILETTGIITVDNKYSMGLGVVDKEYVLDLKEYTGNEQVKDRIVFLLNMAKIAYCPIKTYLDTTGQEFDHKLLIDMNTNLYFSEHTEKRIGVIFRELDQ